MQIPASYRKEVHNRKITKYLLTVPQNDVYSLIRIIPIKEYVMKRRNTPQKQLVQDAVQALQNHPTADDIYEYIRGEHPGISRGTVYRNLSVLSQDGLIHKIGVPDDSDRFDFNLNPHYHVHCIRCGSVFDVDMDPVSHLEQRIRDDHGIRFLSYDILFKGICSDCYREEDSK